MALSASTIWELRTGGDADNGGGFVAGGGTDYSLQDAAQKSGADLAIHASDSTKVEPVAAGVAAADVGNLVKMTAGTGFTTGWYEITAQDGTYWTLDRSAGTTGSTGGTYKMGGALSSIGILGKALEDHGVFGMKAYIKSGTYLLTSTTSNVDGGVLELTTPDYDKTLYVKGYDTDRDGDWGTNRPVIDANGNNASVYVFNCDVGGGNVCLLANVLIDLDNQADLDGVKGESSGRNYCYYVKVINCGSGGYAFNYMRCFYCEATSSSNYRLFATCYCYYCVAHGGDRGFDGCYTVACVADGCTHGFYGGDADMCTAYNCTDGFQSNSNGHVFTNCYAGDCSGYGFDTNQNDVLLNCAGYNNTSGHTNATPILNVGFVTITDGQPLTDPANDDFEPNNTANRGVLLRGVGLATLGQTANEDIGAVQHADPAGGGLSMFNARRNTLIGR